MHDAAYCSLPNALDALYWIAGEKRRVYAAQICPNIYILKWYFYCDHRYLQKLGLHK